MIPIILAAGKGERLRPLTDRVPKPLVTLRDECSILDVHMSNAARQQGIDGVVVVSGYMSAEIEKSEFDAEVEVTVAHNPFYDVAGPLGSVWLAHRTAGNGDFMILNGDTVYAEDVYRDAVDLEEGIHLMVSEPETRAPDDMKTRVDESGNIVSVRKGAAEDHELLSAGVLVVRGGEYRRRFSTLLSSLAHDTEEFVNGYWHELVNGLAENGVNVEPCFVPSDSWFEIDTEQDLTEARQEFVRARN